MIKITTLFISLSISSPLSSIPNNRQGIRRILFSVNVLCMSVPLVAVFVACTVTGLSVAAVKVDDDPVSSVKQLYSSVNKGHDCFEVQVCDSAICVGCSVIRSKDIKTIYQKKPFQQRGKKKKNYVQIVSTDAIVLVTDKRLRYKDSKNQLGTSSIQVEKKDKQKTQTFLLSVGVFAAWR